MARHNFPRTKRKTSARGYGTSHQAERKRWEPVVQSGRVACVRGGFLIAPGTRWHLDHADDKLHYRGPAHASCNLRAAAKRGNKLLREKRTLNPPPRSGRTTSRDW